MRIFFSSPWNSFHISFLGLGHLHLTGSINLGPTPLGLIQVGTLIFFKDDSFFYPISIWAIQFLCPIPWPVSGPFHRMDSPFWPMALGKKLRSVSL